MVERDGAGSGEAAEPGPPPGDEGEAEPESSVVEAWAHEPDPLDPVEGTTEDYTGR